MLYIRKRMKRKKEKKGGDKRLLERTGDLKRQKKRVLGYLERVVH